MTTKLHFTHTGPLAGQPICGETREAAKEAGDKLQHPAYDALSYARQLTELCPKCAEAYGIKS